MNKSSPYPFFRRPKDNIGWAVIIFLAVAILWQVLELLLYGEIQPRRVDDIIGLGDKRKRLKDLEDLQRFPYPRLKVAVINYESTWRDGIYEALEQFDADLIVCDESQRIKTHDSEQSNASRGKACKNMRRLYLMMDGDPNLYLLTVPPTSIKDVNRQIAKIIAGGTPYVGLVVSLTLEKTKNASGVAYSKVVIKKAGKLPPAVMAQAMALRRKIKDQYSNVALTMDDYAPAQTDPNKPQFTETDAATTGDLPFTDAPAKEAEAPHPAEPELPFT